MATLTRVCRAAATRTGGGRDETARVCRYGASAIARSGEPLAPWIFKGVITRATV